MQPTDRLGPALSLKFALGQEQGVIDGVASTFNGPVDAHGDLVAAGAFTASLAEHKANGTSPAMLWSHDMKQPIGRWLEVNETPGGLMVKGQLTLDVPKAREAYALAKDGALGLSIGYRVRKKDHTAGGHRLLKEVSIFEISLVAIPSNHAAQILSVKSAGSGFDPSDITDPRAFEQMLRDLGFARRFAAAVTAGGFKAAQGPRDAGEDAAKQLAVDIRTRASAIRTFSKG